MPAKTDRILSYLPGTFRALPRPTALYFVADAFGNELQHAENSLAAVMLAHWVDKADQGEELITDLACLAALYGLGPRGAAQNGGSTSGKTSCLPLPADEDVEEFREHLKRYVRTFLDGTTTVQGVLRVVADALGLHIADAYTDMDAWWTREDDALVTVESRGDDATALLFGVEAVTVNGSSPRVAQITGLVDLRAGIDLRGASILKLTVDAAAPLELDLVPHVPNPGAATLDDIKKAINSAFTVPIADHDGHYLTLASRTVGPTGRLEVMDTVSDAAPGLFGLLPRTYRGAEATAGRVMGTVDLSGGIDLSDIRYLRLLVDGTQLAEVDCAVRAADPTHATLDEIKVAINTALGITVASHDGHRLALTSPKTGFASSIAFQPAAAQDAAQRLFGDIVPFYIGRDAQPAKVVGTRDLSQGVDLRERSNIQLKLDASAPETINCAGSNPAATLPAEIVSAINAAVGSPVAIQDGRFITVVSRTPGPTGLISFLTPASDALEDIFGIGPRIFHGAAATSAHLVGALDLSHGVDLGALHLLQIELDGGSPVEVDLRTGVANPRHATLEEIIAAVNAQLGLGVASHDGRHLILASPTVGEASRVSVVPLEETIRRRFVTRAFVTDEATQACFGFLRRKAYGGAAAAARVEGLADLSRGVDLREERFLRVGVDNIPFRDVDCAAKSPRPRAALLDEIVQAINGQVHLEVASHNSQHLVLTSPTLGVSSRIAFEPPRAMDALDMVLGVPPQTFRGREGTRVTFRGTADLSAGVNLTTADRVKVGIDGAAPVEIVCAGPDPAHTTLSQIVVKINVALQAAGMEPVARPDGVFISLASTVTGRSRQLKFDVPAGPDATRAIFGIVPPRTYHGAEAQSAQVVGTRDLGGAMNLSVARFLLIAVDGRSPATTVDCAAKAQNVARATLAEIIDSINSGLGARIASADGTFLKLESTKTGLGSQLDLLPYMAGGARQTLLGSVADQTTGSDPTPAVIDGSVDLLAPVNLAERRTLRVAVDGGRPVEIDIAGPAPETTFLDEVVAKINAAMPGLASATPNHHLRLTSPALGEASSLEVLPRRALELIEYPPTQVDEPALTARHGTRWSVNNDGAADAELKIELSTSQGETGSELVNRITKERVRLMTDLRPGDTISLQRVAGGGLRAEIIARDGTKSLVPGSQILAGPLGTQVWVPFAGDRHLGGGGGQNEATLQLNNPTAPTIVVLRALQPGVRGSQIRVSVAEAALGATAGGVIGDRTNRRLVGRLRIDASGYRLEDVAKSTLASLRAGPGVTLDAHADRVVTVRGPFYPGEGTPPPPPLMVVERIADLFDVKLQGLSVDGTATVEAYSAVTIGTGGAAPEDLTVQILFNPSRLVLAEELDKGTVLVLPRGRSEWIYLNCDEARFDHADLDTARFASGTCLERGVFDVSRFARRPPAAELEAAVFAPDEPVSEPAVNLQFHWTRHRPGAFVINLPADLPERFGARFDQARFALPSGAPEAYDGVVTEPEDDPDYLVTRISAKSALVTAAIFKNHLPLGFEQMTMPFRHPRAHALTNGTDAETAKMYLAENEVPGLIELRAKSPGPWGNAVVVTARRSKEGPARFDLTIGYEAARFENARQVALVGQVVPPGEDPLPALTKEILKPRPVGVLQAKAAGVRADVSRDRTGNEHPNH